MLGYFAAVAVATGALLDWANAQPHAAPSASPRAAPTVIAPIGRGPGRPRHFPAADVTNFRTITQGMLDQGAGR